MAKLIQDIISKTMFQLSKVLNCEPLVMINYLFQLFILTSLKLQLAHINFGHFNAAYIDIDVHWFLTSLKLTCPSLSSSISAIMFFKPTWVWGASNFSIINFISIKSKNLSVFTSYLLHIDSKKCVIKEIYDAEQKVRKCMWNSLVNICVIR